MGAQQALGGRQDVVGERLGQGPIGGSDILVAAAQKHGHARLVHVAGRLRYQCRLSLAGLTADEDDLPALPRRHRLGRTLECGQFGLAADHPHGRAMTEPNRKSHPFGHHGADVLRLPHHFQGLDRFGEAFQFQLPYRDEVMRTSSTGGGPNQVRDENLSTFGFGAQPGRLDDRVSEVVVALLGRLPAAQAHPQSQGSLSGGIVAVDPLLHGHGTVEGDRGRAEDDHEPVAQVLHLCTPGGGDGLAQHGEVPVPHLVGGIGRQRGGQLGRADHVGKEHGDVLGCRHLTPFHHVRARETRRAVGPRHC